VPDHYAIEPVSSHDYESFYRQELEQRAVVGYPPFTRLCQVLVSGPDEGPTREAARELAAAAEREARRDGDAQSGGVEILGPAPAPLARLRGRYRFQLLLKGADEAALDRVVRDVAHRASALPRPLRAVVDVNPGSML
jgi:primosomal protein N' (replication factor Y)